MNFRLPIVALALLTAGSTSAAESRAAQLEAFKRQFPDHVAGTVTEKSDVTVQRFWRKYHDAVQALDLATLAEKIESIRQNLSTDILFSDRERTRPTNSARAQHAAEQNIIWMRQKLIPYLQRLEQFQRGH